MEKMTEVAVGLVVGTMVAVVVKKVIVNPIRKSIKNKKEQKLRKRIEDGNIIELDGTYLVIDKSAEGFNVRNREEA